MLPCCSRRWRRPGFASTPAFYVAARTITLFTFIAVSTAWRDTLHWPWYPDWHPIEGTYPLAVGLSVGLACWSLVDRLRQGAYRAPE